jgi:hypothetical protein
VVGAQRLGFLCHSRSVFEWTSWLGCVPVSNKECAQPYQRDTCEKDRILDVEAVAKNLKNSLHHRVGLMGAPQPRRVPRVDQNLVEVIGDTRIFCRYWHSAFCS